MAVEAAEVTPKFPLVIVVLFCCIAPRARKLPVVVAPPFIVRPPVWLLSPMVVDAKMPRPVVVALFGKR